MVEGLKFCIYYQDMNDRLVQKNKKLTSLMEDYLLANKHLPVGFKSSHWDVFDGKFDRLFSEHQVWENMLRNQLTLGLNENNSRLNFRQKLKGVGKK